MTDHDDSSLDSKLAENESILKALRAGQVDAVVSEKQLLMLRLREAERALHQSEARYRAVVEDQPDLVYRWDAQGRLTFVNQAFCQFFRQPCDQLVGSPVGLAIPSETEYSQFREDLASLTSDQPYVDQEHRITHRNGEVHWLHVRHRLILDDEGKATEVQAVARDVTERKRAENALRKANAELEQRVAERTVELRALVHELDEAEQRERQNLAHFLHDELQQLLVAANLHLDRVRKQALNDQQQTSLQDAQALIKQGVEASRSLASQLSPPAMSKKGLVAALYWLADQMQDMHQLPVEVQADAQVEPEMQHIQNLMFMCARELLLNVVKHADAQRTWLRISRQRRGWIALEVCDDGIGFVTDNWNAINRRSTTFGLTTIEERLHRLGGRMQVDSAPGKGCRVTISAPPPRPAQRNTTTPPPMMGMGTAMATAAAMATASFADTSTFPLAAATTSPLPRTDLPAQACLHRPACTVNGLHAPPVQSHRTQRRRGTIGCLPLKSFRSGTPEGQKTRRPEGRGQRGLTIKRLHRIARIFTCPAQECLPMSHALPILAIEQVTHNVKRLCHSKARGFHLQARPGDGVCRQQARLGTRNPPADLHRAQQRRQPRVHRQDLSRTSRRHRTARPSERRR